MLDSARSLLNKGQLATDLFAEKLSKLNINNIDVEMNILHDYDVNIALFNNV